MSLNWAMIETIGDVDTMLDTWYLMFTKIVNKHAPVKSQRVKCGIQLDWLTSEILDGMKERDTCKKNGDFEEYKTLRNKICALIKESKRAAYKSKIETGIRIRIRIVYLWNAETTITHQDLWLGN